MLPSEAVSITSRNAPANKYISRPTMKTVVKFSRIRCTSGGSIVRTVSKRIVEPFLAQYPILKNPDLTRR